jgi:hypothetical protein
MKKYLPLVILLPILSFLWPIAAGAQLGTPSYVAQPGARILSSEWNATVANIHDLALNRQGGTMTGTLISQQITPSLTATYDLGTSSVRFRDFHFSRNGLIGGTLGVTGLITGGAGATITGTVTGTTFNGSGASLTSIPAAQLTGVCCGSATNVPLLNALNTFTAFGTHNFTGSGTGAQLVKIGNSNAGSTTNSSGIQLDIDAAAIATTLKQFSSSFTTSGSNVAGGTNLVSGGTGGISVTAINGAGDIRFYTGGDFLRWGINDAGDFTFGANAHIVDSAAVPTLPAGAFGTGAAISGNVYSFRIVVGTAAIPSESTVNFNTTFSAVPSCLAQAQSLTNPVTVVSGTTTTVNIGTNSAGAFTASMVINVQCRGF